MSTKTAFVFPGQGAQHVGMGHELFTNHAQARAVFNQADEALGYPLTELIFNGPEQQLKITYHTQPALLATSIAFYEAFRESGVRADYLAGHSLGEYSALVVSGVLSVADAVQIVAARGRFMEQAVPGGLGAMAAVLGAERTKLADLCARLSAEVGLVELANVNCPGQIVVSGSAQGVQAVVEHGREIGAKRVIPLDVSGPFHSSLMKPASDQLAERLNDFTFHTPSIPIVANVTGRPATDESQIRELLVQQVYSPVLWEDTIVWLIEQGVDVFVELGAGTVLSGLIRKIDRGVAVHSVHDLDSLKLAVSQLT